MSLRLKSESWRKYNSYLSEFSHFHLILSGFWCWKIKLKNFIDCAYLLKAHARRRHAKMAGLGTSAGDVTSRFCRLSLAAISIKIILNKEICALSKLSKLMTSSTLPPHHIPLFAEKKVERKSFQMRVKQEEAGKRYTHTTKSRKYRAFYLPPLVFIERNEKSSDFVLRKKYFFFNNLSELCSR